MQTPEQGVGVFPCSLPCFLETESLSKPEVQLFSYVGWLANVQDFLSPPLTSVPAAILSYPLPEIA